VGAMAMPPASHFPMQGVDFVEGDVLHLGVLAKMRDDVAAKHPLIVLAAALTQTREVLLAEALDQIGYGRRVPFLLLVGERIAAFVDQMAQPLRLDAGVGGVPIAEVANGIAALAATAVDVIQNERAMAGGGDASAEASHALFAAVVVNPIALLGHRQVANDGVR